MTTTRSGVRTEPRPTIGWRRSRDATTPETCSIATPTSGPRRARPSRGRGRDEYASRGWRPHRRWVGVTDGDSGRPQKRLLVGGGSPTFFRGSYSTDRCLQKVDHHFHAGPGRPRRGAAALEECAAVA